MKKRNIAYLILIIGLILLGIGFLFLAKPNKTTSLFTKEWKTYVGEIVNNKEIEEYDEKEFYLHLFYSTKNGKTIKHSFYCPIDSGYIDINKYNSQITNNILSISYKDTDIEDIKAYINDLSNQNNKKNIFIEGKVLDNKITPIYLIHEISTLKENNLMEERMIFLTNNEYSSYSILEYKVNNYKLSKNILKQIESNYKIKYDKNTSCINNTCTFDYTNDSNIKKMISFQNNLIDFEEFSISKKDNSIISLMNVKEDNKNIDANTITISILYNKNISIMSKISSFNPNISSEELNIDDKLIYKYNYPYNEDSKEYTTNYYYLIEDDLALEYNIISKENNTDELIEKLLNITIN